MKIPSKYKFLNYWIFLFIAPKNKRSNSIPDNLSDKASSLEDGEIDDDDDDNDKNNIEVRWINCY